MADNYEVESVREITDVDPESGDLLDYVEAHAKTKPHGIAISIRVPAQGASSADIGAQLSAKATELENVHNL